MPDCRPTGNERFTGPWEYVGASAVEVTASHGPMGQTGVAMKVMYVWRRPLEKEFTCCEGAQQVTVWAGGYYRVHTFEREPAGYPVLTLGAGLPLPGALGTIADVVGAGVDIAHWWIQPGGVDGEKPADPSEDVQGTDSLKEIHPPKATCGEYVEMPDGEREYPWQPAGGTAPPPPPPAYEPIPVQPRVPWRPADNNCCKDLTWLQRRPVLEIVRRNIWQDGAHYKIDLLLHIKHQCGIESISHMEYFLVYPSGSPVPLSGLLPPLHRRTTLPNGKGYAYEWENQQIPIPAAYSGGGFRVDVTAVSRCKGVLNATFRFTQIL